MARCILVTTDRSPSAEPVLAHAAALARAIDGELVLGCVLDPKTDLSGEVGTDLREAAGRVQERWTEGLQQTLDAAGIAGRPAVTIQARNEDTKDAVVRLAGELEAVLIAMHSRGTGSALRHAILGSVAMGVLGNAGVGIMVSGANVVAADTNDPFRIVVATSTEDETLPLIRDLARLYTPGARVDFTLLTIDPTEPFAAGRMALADRLHELRMEFPQGAEVDTRIVKPDPPGLLDMAIIQAAREAEADAIAIATHGRGAIRHLISGSVALDVLSRSPVPVILSAAK